MINFQTTISFLDKEPEPNPWYKQFLFRFTRPIAEFLDGFRINKLRNIDKRRYVIAKLQEEDFIDTVAKLLYDEVLTYGKPTDEYVCKSLCIEEARDIFYEKKINGELDELNRIIN